MKPKANIIFANFLKKQDKLKLENIIKECEFVIIKLPIN